VEQGGKKESRTAINICRSRGRKSPWDGCFDARDACSRIESAMDTVERERKKAFGRRKQMAIGGKNGWLGHAANPAATEDEVRKRILRHKGGIL